MSDNRRDFIKKSIALAAVSAAGLGTASAEISDAEFRDRMETLLAQPGKKSTMRIVMQPNARANVNTMTWYKQMGLEDVTVWTDPPNDNAEFYKGTRLHFAEQGINVYGLGNGAVHNQDKIVLNLPGRDAKVEEYKKHLRNLGAAGITYTTYAHMGNGIWDSPSETTRGGASARAFDQFGVNSGRWNKNKYYPPLSHGREYSEEELWDNWTYFIRQVAPVAEENNVRIGVHPDDPPIPKLAGVPRIFSHFERYKKAMEIANSPNVGLCLCVGSWMEGGNTTGKSPVEMIDYFGAQKKIFKVHFRNIERPIPHFVETFVDSGYTNMYTIMKALKRVNFDGVVFPDHVPGMAGGNAWPFSVGYVKALRDRVEAEALV
ncbi:mannonate dehydratase [Mucilaginibacter sp.]|uniref:mannonate dehydratase n=1 Tax=Mucilaginibacter sp. TaxID=1882438 RepID=UPI002616B933|nr:mannonate dehydratase [Mucilaginibacter sp.]MDB4925705.1 D-mannonate dehydratase [Mucilaginibacter sp.]